MLPIPQRCRSSLMESSCTFRLSLSVTWTYCRRLGNSYAVRIRRSRKERSQIVVTPMDGLARGYEGCEFLPPTHTDEGVVVGMSFEGRTILAEDRILSVAYHKLFAIALT